MTARTARHYLLSQLQNQLYSEFYIRGKASPKLWNDEDERSAGTDFIDSHQQRMPEAAARETGWEVIDIVADEFAVRRHRLTLWVTRGDLETIDDRPVSLAGAMVKLPMSKEMCSVSPGYYTGARRSHRTRRR